MDNDFRGRVAFVTGGTSGIGLATARAFVDAGAKVVVAARGREAGERARDELGAHDALFVAMDVIDEASVAAAVQETIDHFGRLDFAVNAAGIGGHLAPIEETDQEIWDRVMTVNARGVWLSMRYEVPAMLASGGGAIVNLSSIYGLVGKANHHAYVASKHAVVGMTRSAALELARRGVRVNALCAGATRTPAMVQAEAAMPEAVEQLVQEHPMERMATEAEIADAVVWLCSPGAGFVTGAAHVVDGGLLAA